MEELFLGRDAGPAKSAWDSRRGQADGSHPFREGNGRTMRVFIDQFARSRGFRFDQTKLDAEGWNEASRLNFMDADAKHFRPVLLQALTRLD